MAFSRFTIGGLILLWAGAMNVGLDSIRDEKGTHYLQYFGVVFCLMLLILAVAAFGWDYLSGRIATFPHDGLEVAFILSTLTEQIGRRLRAHHPR